MSVDTATSSKNHSILVVDDELPARRSLARTLELNGFRPILASSIAEARKCLEENPLDAAFLDIMLGNEDGMDLLKWMVKEFPVVPAIMFTKLRDIDKAVAAVKIGAYDYLEKGCDNDRVKVTVTNAIKWRELELERTGLRDRITEGNGLLGDSAAMEKLREHIAKLASHDIDVLITGETGTGKELVAAALHNQSRRASKRLEFVDSTTIESLTEDYLFGHVKGSYTGATDKHDGAFLRANGGTLVLDEIGKLHPSVQAKLLRVLQERVFMPLGSDKEVAVDVRFIAATNRSLEAMVVAGEFREDLLHRVKVGMIRVPPLRERREDIPLLTNAFLGREFRRHAKSQQQIAPEAMNILLAYEWPGNVRQLEHLCEYLCAMNEGTEIEDDAVRDWLFAEEQPASQSQDMKDYFLHIRECKVEYFERLLILHGYNVPNVARVAGIDKAGCYRLLKSLGLYPKNGQKSTV